jgi:hypothetical protein
VIAKTAPFMTCGVLPIGLSETIPSSWSAFTARAGPTASDGPGLVFVVQAGLSPGEPQAQDAYSPKPNE